MNCPCCGHAEFLAVKLGHVGLTVSDLERSIDWYSWFGFKVTFRIERDEPFIGEIVGIPGAHIRIAYLEAPGGGMLELLEYVSPKGDRVRSEPNMVGCLHVCLEVEELVFCPEIEVMGWATIPDGRNKGTMVAYCRDPDGIIVELSKRA